MKRRSFLRYAPASLLAAAGAGSVYQLQAQAQDGSLSVQFLGHTCFLFSGSGLRVLVNPFRQVGCTKNLPAPRVGADIVMISSRLFDEGYIEGLSGRPKLLFEPGSYRTSGLQIQGVKTLHDRVGGFRFGTNVAWAWNQGGVRIVHLGGIASPVSIEQRILLGKPDLLFIPVGGGDKAYTPEEAKAAVAVLEPRMIIPTHYRTGSADPKVCNLSPVDAFLSVMGGGTPVRRVGGGLGVSQGSLPASPTIMVMS